MLSILNLFLNLKVFEGKPSQTAAEDMTTPPTGIRESDRMLLQNKPGYFELYRENVPNPTNEMKSSALKLPKL